MNFTQVLTEQTTAMTDIIFAIAAISIVFALIRDKNIDNKKRNLIWLGYFSCYFIGGVIGTIGHGLNIDEGILNVLWSIMYLVLGLGIGFFAIAVLNDLFNKMMSKFIIGICLIPSVIFYLVTVFISGSFTVFVLYTMGVTILGLIAYVIIFFRTKEKSILILFLGTFFTILTGVAHLLISGEFQFIWTFNSNGPVHIIQAIGLAITYLGIIKTQKLFKF